jgi:pilus assembly protein CpaC
MTGKIQRENRITIHVGVPRHPFILKIHPRIFKINHFILFVELCCLFLASPLVFAQKHVPSTVEVPVELQDPPKTSLGNDEEIVDDSINRRRKFLTLTVGIEHEEALTGLPKELDLKGDYGKAAEVVYDPATGILRVNPTNVGVGSVTLHNKKSGKLLYEMRLDIKKSSLDKVAREIKSLLGDIEGISIKILNNKVVVDGQILLPRDMSRIGNVVMQYADQAVSLVSLSPMAQKKISEIIERDINNPEINVRAINDKFILEGIANSPDEKARAEIIAKTYVPDTVLDPAEEKFIKRRKVESVINLIVIRDSPAPPPGKMIQIVVHYVELDKDYTNSFSFHWGPGLVDQSNVQFGMDSSKKSNSIYSSIVGTINSLFPKLNWLKTHNHARILESSTLIVEEGSKGEMKSVTNVPFTNMQPNGVTSTQFQQVGMSTTITPFLISKNSDSIKLDLLFAISQLVGGDGQTTTESNVHTSITVRSGQSAAVAGLIRNNSGTAYNRLPADASSNPIIRLHSSKAFARNQSQFVIFVTPVIKSSASAGVEKVKKKFRMRD